MSTDFSCATTVANTIVAHLPAPLEPNLHYRFAFTARGESITGDWRKLFYKSIAGDVRALGGKLVRIGGANQTVILRVVLPPTHAPDRFARRLKILSASRARRKADRPEFAWRDDYEAVTLDSFLPEQQSARRNRGGTLRTGGN